MNIVEKEIERRQNILDAVAEKKERIAAIEGELSSLMAEVAEVNCEVLEAEVCELLEIKHRLEAKECEDQMCCDACEPVADQAQPSAADVTDNANQSVNPLF